jgi:predicted enzyme related to lactoylglutathione lyase
MITSIHLLQYSRDPAADRAFLRDVLGWPSVEDVSSEPGWLIFALPPTELGVHPTEGEPLAELHLMCDDITATVTELQSKGVEITGPVEDRGYGLATGVTLPSGATIGLYEPRHASPLDL